mgnify:CR=1 FL=1
MTVATAKEIATLVVCEDDEPTLELLCDHLSADRFATLAAPTASDALRLCTFSAQPAHCLGDPLRAATSLGKRAGRQRILKHGLPVAIGERWCVLGYA